ncbi:MAG: undecaprenyl-diphosphate phosphatase [Phycisphaerae bacterium]|nr:undecaprenyl-diphosphate phosphatase [Saprospiraceae bacterium]
MTLLEAIVLAIIEGLTEFLPVSSTGHMIIGSSAMGIASEPFVKLFTVAIQFGAILSVLVLYWRRFFQSIGFYIKLLVAFLPAVFFGLLFKKQIDALLENIVVVAIALIVGGIIFILLDNFFKRQQMRETSVEQDVTLPRALRIGFFQVISMIPGVSRSAATIFGGLANGLSPTTAAEFSFFLAVPTMFAATCKSLWDFIKDGGGTFSSHDMMMLGVGNVVAFLVAMAAIKYFIQFLTKHGFKWFGWYRIVVGVAILILWKFGYFDGVSVGDF